MVPFCFTNNSVCFNIFLEPDPCKQWPENYFEKYDEPNDTLVEEMYKYGSKNLALIHVMIQSPYVTKIKRDVAMTFTTYIANSGGLLGLCLGFSFMSGIEIMFCLCWLCREFEKKACSKNDRCLSVEANNCENHKEEELHALQNNHNSNNSDENTLKNEIRILKEELHVIKEFINNSEKEIL